MPIPDSIAGAPQLRPGLEVYWEAFSDLTSERAIGFGSPGPIPWTAVTTWAAYHGMGKADTEELRFLLAKMDECFLAHMARELKKQET